MMEAEWGRVGGGAAHAEKSIPGREDASCFLIQFPICPITTSQNRGSSVHPKTQALDQSAGAFFFFF